MNNDITIKDIQQCLWNRKWSIVGCTAAVATLCLAGILLTPQQYTAESSILLKKQNTGLTGVFGNAELDFETTILDRVATLESKPLASKVIATLQLNSDPEFRPEDAQEGAALNETQKSEVVTNFLSQLSVVSADQSNVVSLSFNSTDPQKASKIANTLVDEYIQSQRAMDLTRTTQARSWLVRRGNQLQDEVVNSERQLITLRDSKNLPITNRQLTEQEVATISGQLLSIRNERNDAQAKLAQASLAAKNGVPDAAILAFGNSVNSNTIQNLINRKIEARKQVAELSTEYGPRHPLMLAARAEVANTDRLLRAEPRKVVNDLRREVDVLRSRESTLESRLGAASNRANQDFSGNIDLDRLEREVASKRSLLTAVLANRTALERHAGVGIAAPAASVISPAEIPHSSSSPSRVGLMLLGTIAGLFLGVLWAFAREATDTRMRTARALRSITDLPIIGQLPSVASAIRNKLSPSLHLHSDDSSVYAKNIRDTHWNLQLRDLSDAAKCVLVTSPTSKDGKSTVATSLAISKRRTGSRVLVIDACFDNPSVFRTLRVKRHIVGLSTLVSKVTSLKQLIRHDQRSKVHLWDCGPEVRDPATLFTHPAIIDAINQSKGLFDWIIIDAPSIDAGPDALLLSQFADDVVVVVDSTKPQREVLDGALKRISNGVNKPVTLLMNKMIAGQIDSNLLTDIGLESRPATESGDSKQVVSISFPGEDEGADAANTARSLGTVASSPKKQQIIEMLEGLGVDKAK